MLRFDWLSYNAICYSSLVAKSARHICNVLSAKKDLSLVLTSARCFVSIFFLTNYIDFTKAIIPLALRAFESIAHPTFGLIGLLTQSPFGLEE